MLKTQMLSMEQEKCTLHPDINPLSRLIADKLRQSNPDTLSRSRDKNMTKTLSYLRDRETK